MLFHKFNTFLNIYIVFENLKYKWLWGYEKGGREAGSKAGRKDSSNYSIGIKYIKYPKNKFGNYRILHLGNLAKIEARAGRISFLYEKKVQLLSHTNGRKIENKYIDKSDMENWMVLGRQEHKYLSHFFVHIFHSFHLTVIPLCCWWLAVFLKAVVAKLLLLLF